MAQDSQRKPSRAPVSEAPVSGPMLNPGQRPRTPPPAEPLADPEVTLVDAGTTAPVGAAGPAEAYVDHPTEPEVTDGPDLQQRQARLRVLLHNCDRVQLLDFRLLSMPDWPDGLHLAAARRRRDYWLIVLALCAVCFVGGVLGLLPAWIGGVGFGALVVGLGYALPPVQHLLSRQPTLTELTLRRYQLLRQARDHITYLEGEAGLAWQCTGLADYNPSLRQARYQGLRHLSEQRVLPRMLRTRRQIRLYLLFLLDAERAYKRAQADYLAIRQRLLDDGQLPDAGATEPGPADAS